MDLQFLKFWSDAIRQSSAVQTLADEAGRWMKGDIKESDELYALFRKYYGLDQGGGALKDYEAQVKEVLAGFQKSFKELIPFMGVVPRSEYDHLQQENEELKKKAEDLEKTIEKLRMRLNDSAPGQTGSAGEFDRILKTQTDQFQKLMNTFSVFSGPKAPENKDK